MFRVAPCPETFGNGPCRASERREHEVVVLVAGAEQEPLLGLLAPPGLERTDDVVVDVDGAPAVGGLHVGEPQLVVHDDRGLADVDQLGVGVDVAPPQARDLATSHPGVGGQANAGSRR